MYSSIKTARALLTKAGNYNSYNTLADFTALLESLAKIKGKFLLSSYPSEVLADYTKKYGWKTVEVQKNLGMRKEENRNKVEVLTMNYTINDEDKG